MYEDLSKLCNTYKNINIISNRKDQQNIDKALSSLFVFYYDKLDKNKNNIKEIIKTNHNFKDTISYIRTKYTLYGDGIFIPDNDTPYIEMDCSLLEKMIDDFMSINFRSWLTDKHMNWCIQINGNEITYATRSPFIKIQNLIRNRFK